MEQKTESRWIAAKRITEGNRLEIVDYRLVRTGRRKIIAKFKRKEN